MSTSFSHSTERQSSDRSSCTSCRQGVFCAIHGGSSSTMSTGTMSTGMSKGMDTGMGGMGMGNPSMNTCTWSLCSSSSCPTHSSSSKGVTTGTTFAGGDMNRSTGTGTGHVTTELGATRVLPTMHTQPEILPVEHRTERLAPEIRTHEVQTVERVIQPIEKQVIRPVEVRMEKPIIHEERPVHTTIVQPVVQPVIREEAVVSTVPVERHTQAQPQYHSVTANTEVRAPTTLHVINCGTMCNTSAGTHHTSCPSYSSTSSTTSTSTTMCGTAGCSHTHKEKCTETCHTTEKSTRLEGSTGKTKKI